jgi:uncharacterized protein
MKSRSTIALTILFLSFSLVVSAQKKKQESKEPVKHKIVIQFNDADSVSQVRAVMQIENIRKIWTDAEVELVCLGGGLDLLTRKNSKASKMVADWGAVSGITFAACNNTMTVRNIKKEDLLPQAVVIPSAVIELALKQQEGWSYFRGGK